MYCKVLFSGLIIALLTFASACRSPASEAASPPPPVALTVFAAASLTAVFTEIGKEFEIAHPSTTVIFNFGGSNQLAEQINQGAPVDVFASANKKQMEAVIEGGRIAGDRQQTFARNRLVVIFPVDNPAGIVVLQDLAKPGIKLVLAAKEAPVGQYALDFLAKADRDAAFGATFKAEALKNVVSYEENVKAVFTKVALGEADAGIVYASDVAGSETRRVAKLDIPDSLNTIATYPIAPIKDSAQAGLAQAFVGFVLSPAGQAILAKYGFIPVD